MSRIRTRGAISGPLLAIGLGVIGGLALLALTLLDFGFGFGGRKIDRTGRVAISINGVSPRMARDVLLPTHGWTLQIRFPEYSAEAARDGLSVMLRSERTGATIQIEDRFDYQDGLATLTIPRSLGLAEGLLSVRASFTDASEHRFEDSRRIRIRSWFGGAPVGFRQFIHFDFEVDRDGDEIPDFLKDLERFGLASPDLPELARSVAAQIEDRAIARVEQAYDVAHDPNETGQARDPVQVRFRSESDPSALVTRICVGGSDPANGASVGHVRFDRHNEEKTSDECGEEPIAGLFPGELEIYRDARLYRDVFGPFLESNGGTPIGGHAEDSIILQSKPVGEARNDAEMGRRADIARAITVFGDVLGSIMAHEAGHALGLVAPGRPGIGLFGGTDGDTYAHNVDPIGEPEEHLWLMNPGGGFTFAELAGYADSGVLNFRPINYAYLRDRIVLSDKR
jgi:hypothetical protein